MEGRERKGKGEENDVGLYRMLYVSNGLDVYGRSWFQARGTILLSFSAWESLVLDQACCIAVLIAVLAQGGSTGRSDWAR